MGDFIEADEGQPDRAAEAEAQENHNCGLEATCKLVRKPGVKQIERHCRHDDNGVDVTRIFLQTNVSSKLCKEVELRPETFQEDEGSG